MRSTFGNTQTAAANAANKGKRMVVIFESINVYKSGFTKVKIYLHNVKLFTIIFFLCIFYCLFVLPFTFFVYICNPTITMVLKFKVI